MMTDLHIRIFPPGNGQCRVEARVDESSRYDGEATFDVNALRGLQGDPVKYGQLLRDALFASRPLQRTYQAYLRASAGRPVRLRLAVDAPEISEMRWERLMLEADGGDLPAAASPQTPFSRYFEREEPPLTSTDIPNVLLAIASPSDLRILAPIDVDAEVDNLLDAWESLLNDGSLRLTIMPGRSGLSAETKQRARGYGPWCRVVDEPTTLDALSRELGTVDGLHLIAHGNLVERKAVLVLEREDGTTALVEEDVLRVKFQQPRLRFAFLHSCKSAEGIAVGLGAKLLEFGVPAVVAMQEFVPMADARRFAAAFYGVLIRDGAADVATNAGRQEIWRGRSGNWSIPVLFCRLKDAQIWRPDPVRAAVRKLAKQYQASWNVQHPFPLDAVLVRRGLSVLQHGTEGVSGPKLTLTEGSLQALRETAKPFVLLLGSRGRAKSTHLQCLFVRASASSLDNGGVVPLLISLADCVPDRGSPAATIAWAVAQAFCRKEITADGLDPSRLEDALSRRACLFLVDGDDDIGGQDRADAIGTLARFQDSAKPQHQIFVTADESTFDPEPYPDRTVALILRPMAPERVSAHLTLACPDISKALVRDLRENGLFDIAAIPWVLSRLIDNARQGRRITSRTKVLERFVREGLVPLGSSPGGRSRAEQALNLMAWRMQSNRQNALNGGEAFAILAEVLGNRYFLLGQLLEGLLKSGLLVSSGPDGVRFAYPGLQWYCCANYLNTAPERERERSLEDITASLGRISRVRLWEWPLVALAGLTQGPDQLLRKILAGSSLTEGEQVFVAARCLHEARCAAVAADGIGRDVVDQIVDTLVWRSRAENVRSTAARRTAIEAVALLAEKCVVPHLVSLAIRRVRRDWEGKSAFEYSSVRQAAVRALFAMQNETLDYARTDPELSQDRSIQELIEAWLALDVKALAERLATEDPKVAAVAAFALGTINTEECLDALVERFGGVTPPSGNGDVLWAITDTLSELDPVKVTERAIRPLLGQPARATYVAYLIGQLGIASPDSDEIAFLHRCLLSEDSRLQGRALRSYAALVALHGDPDSGADVEALRDLCHELVRGDFAKASKRSLIQLSPSPPNEQRDQLRYQALQALRSVGDERSIEVLRDMRRRRVAIDGAGTATFDPTRLSFEIAEEIYWRLTGGLSAETCGSLNTKRASMR
jgi:CHAT domain